MSNNYSPRYDKAEDVSDFERSSIAVFEVLLKKHLYDMFPEDKWSFRFRKNIGLYIDTETKTIDIPKAETPEQIQALRGQIDQIALKLRYHDEATHELRRPSTDVQHDIDARSFYDRLENIRYTALGANTFKGVAYNTEHHFKERFFSRPEINNYDDLEPYSKKLIAYELLLREALCKDFSLDDVSSFTDGFKDQFDKYKDKVKNLSTSLDDQEQYSKLSLDLINQFMSLDSGERETEQDDAAPEDNQNQEGTDTPSESPQEQQQAEDETTEKENSDSNENNKNEEEQEQQQQVASSDQAFESGDDDEFASAESEQLLSHSYSKDEFYDGYRIFTDKNDEIIYAGDIAPDKEKKKLRESLNKLSQSFRHEIKFIGRKIKQYLMAQQQTHWQFDLEEGLLDTSRLSRVVTNPTASLSFKQEINHKFLDTIVTIVVDNSGSMRGRPIVIAATCTDILVETLEQCGVKTEILGYTTKAWKGGLSKQDWLQHGKLPAEPGRLNDLRHIIYKPADMHLRRCQENFGVMLKEGLLKENIDGEALIWAYRRLLKRPEKRKIMIVISDGAPVDDATNTHNRGGNYLEHHLKRVTQLIDKEKKVELTAIGIGYNVNKFYANAIQIKSAEDLGKTLAEKLITLFAEKDSPAARRRLKQLRFDIQHGAEAKH